MTTAFAAPIAKGCACHSLTPYKGEGSICSSFSNRFVLRATPISESFQNRRAQIYMKKGRSRQNIQPRGQERMSLPEDGTPIFALFVRTKRAKMWYPLGAVQGDDRSKTLVNALKGGIAKGMYQNSLDKGIAQTVYGKDSDRFRQNAFRMYPQLKKYQNNLEYGYKVAAVGLDEQELKIVTKDMALPFTAWAKKKLDQMFKQEKDE